VHKDNMLKHTNEFGGIVFSQKVLLSLVEKGLTREKAYAIVQRNALDAFTNNGNFKGNLLADEEVLKYMSRDEIDKIFDAQSFLQNIETIYNKILD